MSIIERRNHDRWASLDGQALNVAAAPKPAVKPGRWPPRHRGWRRDAADAAFFAMTVPSRGELSKLSAMSPARADWPPEGRPDHVLEQGRCAGGTDLHDGLR